ncbi:PAS sensor protein [Nitrosococcus halophilus Nc 4]|uniref:PAS sensor protein n=1 Tax=Nitrosococcus halophilus (strain Nc4) TaxID=472759 RepID=D5BVD1_NITHN|nr:PAS sensor domain-containing protein [Nitrosococcus halophilus]ADE13559.1 PAS sensor protein [Nitrosococcus halophilus Nc 4]
MSFIVEKDEGLIPRVLSQILDSCVNGVSLTDPDQEDNPLVYVNEAFEKITGYKKEEILGKNCRFLQGNDRDQEEVKRLREAIQNRVPIEVDIRNYKKNGELFYNHLAVNPVFDQDGNLLYFLGIQYDVTKQVLAEQEIEKLRQLLGEKT